MNSRPLYSLTVCCGNHYVNLFFFFNSTTPNIARSHLIAVPPKITPFTFGDEVLNAGDPVSVQCTITGGDLPVTVSWLLNGRPIEPSFLDIFLEKRGHRMNNLMIDSVTAKHSGNYTCVANNLAGSVQHSAALIVNGLLPNIYFLFFFCITPGIRILHILY